MSSDFGSSSGSGSPVVNCDTAEPLGPWYMSLLVIDYRITKYCMRLPLDGLQSLINPAWESCSIGYSGLMAYVTLGTSGLPSIQHFIVSWAAILYVVLAI